MKKEPQAKTRYRCPMCGSLSWPSMFKREINFDVKIQQSIGYKNIIYMNGSIAPDVFVKVRSFFIRRCYDILHKLQVTKTEILQEFGMKDIAQEMKLLELTKSIDLRGNIFHVEQLTPRFGVEIKPTFNVER